MEGIAQEQQRTGDDARVVAEEEATERGRERDDDNVHAASSVSYGRAPGRGALAPAVTQRMMMTIEGWS